MKRVSIGFTVVSLLGLSLLLTGCPTASENGGTSGGGGGGGGIGKNFSFGELTGASSTTPSGLLTRNAGSADTTALLGKFTDLSLSNPTRIREIGKVVFSSAPQQTGQGGGLQIGIIDAAGTTPVNLTPTVDFDYYYPALSPKATHIASVQSAKLVIHNSDGTGRTVLTDSAPFAVLNSFNSWSPNNQKIAFVSYTGDLNSNPNYIQTINKDGTGLTQITNTDGVQDRDPAWSPDGTKIAFVRNPPFGTAGLHSLMVVGASGGTVTPILTDPDNRLAHPTWSPDGMHLAVSVGSVLKKVDLDGRNLFTLTEPGTGENDTVPSWSARNYIAFVRSKFVTGGLEQKMKVIDTDGAESFSNPTTGIGLSWSPAGDKIAYGTPGTSSQDISILNTRGGSVTLLQKGAFAPSWANPNRSNRHLVGGSGEMSPSATGMIFGGRPAGRAANDTPTSLLTFDSSSVASSFNVTLPADMNTGTNIVYKIEGKTASDTLSTLVYWNFSANDPMNALAGSSADGALVTFDSSSGEISSVTTYQITGRAANTGSPRASKEGANLVLRGTFKAVWDKKGKNLAPQGATEVRYDYTGRVLSIR